MKQLSYFFIIGQILLSIPCWSQTTVTLSGEKTIACPAVATAIWSTPPPCVTFSNLTRGSGVTCATAPNALNGSGFSSATPADAFAANKYYTVTITAGATPFTLSSITWLTAISTGTANFTIQYKNNGGAVTDFGTPNQTGTSSNTFTGSVTVDAGTSIIIYAIPSNASAAATIRFKNASTFVVTSLGAPTGSSTQSFCEPATVADLTATGDGIQWYSAASGGSALPSGTPLVDDAIYYASQSVDGCESVNRFPVTAFLVSSPSAVSVTPPSPTICFGTSQMLTASGGNASTIVSSGTLSLGTIPNNSSTGVSSTLNVAGIPTGVTIDSVQVIFNASHTKDSDFELNLAGPNGKIINLVADKGNNGDNFINTMVSSSGAGTAFTTSNTATPFTGLFDADASNPAAVIATSNAPNTNSWATFLSGMNGNGDWVLRAYDDDAAADVGTLNDWTLRIFYKTYTWSPDTDLFTDPGATTAYISGNSAPIVYAKPSSESTYTVTSSNDCGSTNVDVTIVVNTTPEPTGPVLQSFCGSVTIADLDITGTDVQWYAASTGGSALSSSTPLVDEMTYYATQTLLTCESVTRLAVDVIVQSITTTPVITGPLCDGSTSVSGTNGEADGTIIELFIDDISQGTTTVSSGEWTMTGLSLLEGNVVTVISTAPDECVSELSAPVTVLLAPSDLSYSESMVVYCEGTAITPNVPTITGSSPFTWSIDHALPSGLDFDIMTGEITGTPLTGHGATDYVVTASNDCGSTTYNINIAIDPLINYYVDGDGDGFGAGTALPSCTDPGAGYSTLDTDCDDNNSEVYPNDITWEVCNTIDDNCDAEIDNIYQCAPAFPNVTTDITATTATISWTTVPCADFYEYRIRYKISPGVFSAFSAWQSPVYTTSVVLTGLTPNTSYQFQVWDKCTVYSLAKTSAFFTTCSVYTFYADTDMDGYGDPLSSITVECNATPPAGYSSNNQDCNDSDASVHFGATELCNDIDDNCDMVVDNAITYYNDADSDGYGDPATATPYCVGSEPSGYITTSGDCDDTRNFVYPGAPEICNGFDNNCDGLGNNVSSCPKPTAGTTVPGITTATLNWSEVPCAALGYEYRLRSSSSPGSWTAYGPWIPTASNSVFVTGLMAVTTYQYQVRARCATNKYSTAATSAAFTTFNGALLSSGAGTDMEEHVINSNIVAEVYPNPSTGIFTLELISEGNENSALITLTDAYGRLLTEYNADIVKGMNQQNIDLTEYPEAVYFLFIKINQEIVNLKLIKQSK